MREMAQRAVARLEAAAGAALVAARTADLKACTGRPAYAESWYAERDRQADERADLLARAERIARRWGLTAAPE